MSTIGLSVVILAVLVCCGLSRPTKSSSMLRFSSLLQCPEERMRSILKKKKLSENASIHLLQRGPGAESNLLNALQSQTSGMK